MRSKLQSSMIRGGWQLTPAHLIKSSPSDGLAVILDAIDKGFYIFDCADIYTGVEELFGKIRSRAGTGTAPIRIHTKFVPDRADLRDISFFETQAIIDRSLRRLRVDKLDLVQFHWWDCSIPRHLQVLEYLFKLRDAGKVEAVGLTNFDGPQLKEILDAGFDVASIQVQYSVVDRRCEATLLPLCRARGIKLYAYGSLLGGFLNESWLDCPEPSMADLENRSLIKYKLIIDDWGGWARYQSLLRQIQTLATRRGSTMAQVAIGAVLGSGRADAAIIGLSQRHYLRQNVELANITPLSSEELGLLWSWECPLPGDVYRLERTNQRHAGIMKYNLNRQS